MKKVSAILTTYNGEKIIDGTLQSILHQDSIEVCKSLYTRCVDGSNLSLDEAYRNNDFFYSLKFIETYKSAYPKEVALSYKRLHGSLARYYYVMGNMTKARYYFRKSEYNLKTILYCLTSYVGSSWVKKKFNVFG